MKNEKMMVYNLREFDEREFFDKYSSQYGIDIISTSETPTPENAYLAEGCKYINIITTPVNRELLEIFRSQGTEYLVTRTIGYDHIDAAAAKELGIRIANTPYGPDGVAEYTIMLMLMCIRKMKSINNRFISQDYTLKGLIGRELSDMTVGIIGTGRIGTRLAEMLSGFGCRILASSPHPNEKAAAYAEYVTLDKLYESSDIITLHAPANAETKYMISSEALSFMKDGVVLINTARGALIDSSALISGLDSGKIGAAGLDVVEDESELFYYDRRGDVLRNKNMYLLSSYPNVCITHHMAFYTKQAVETMVRDSIAGAALNIAGKENPWLV
ncbi:MAG: D-isomer specific 2-hydroxyacid dehydrogenase family protein [Ruminococcus sp.]|nr:D-isomer specific 2-hydroxyacid dehydrogenase family protein [Ruminococcus sp.]